MCMTAIEKQVFEDGKRVGRRESRDLLIEARKWVTKKPYHEFYSGVDAEALCKRIDEAVGEKSDGQD